MLTVGITQDLDRIQPQEGHRGPSRNDFEMLPIGGFDKGRMSEGASHPWTLPPDADGRTSAAERSGDLLLHCRVALAGVTEQAPDTLQGSGQAFGILVELLVQRRELGGSRT